MSRKQKPKAVKKSVKRVAKKEAQEVNDNYEGKLIERLGQCETVIHELEVSTVWSIVQSDLEEQRQMLDDNWQEIVEPDKLQKARELKHATMHILRLKDKYQEEMNQIKKELNLIANPDKEIPKDYDTE